MNKEINNCISLTPEIVKSLHVVALLSLLMAIKCHLCILVLLRQGVYLSHTNNKKAGFHLCQKFLALISRRAPGQVTAVSLENVSPVIGVRCGSCFLVSC